MKEHELLEYLLKNIRDEQALRVREWMLSPDTAEIARRELKNVWDNYSVSMTEGAPDFDKIFRNINKRIARTSNIHLRTKAFPRMAVIVGRIAAVLFIPLVLLNVFLWMWRGSDGNRVTMHEIVTKAGTTTRIELSDGSAVWLNDGTRLRYPDEFVGKERRIFVDGEAYFEIESDKDHPFIVENPMVNTVVTGTKFNLNAYSEDGVFEATLIEGVITLEKEDLRMSVEAGTRMTFSRHTGRWTSRTQPVELSHTWLNGELTLEDETLDNVFRKLERWYGVDFVVADESIYDMVITAKIKSEKLEAVLDGISRALLLKCTINQDMNSYNRTVSVSRR